MDLPSAKDLKKLAAACRKAGITSFKGGGIEFTLTPESQAKVVKSKGKVIPQIDTGETPIESDELGPEAMLFWSVSDKPETSEGQEQ